MASTILSVPVSFAMKYEEALSQEGVSVLCQICYCHTSIVGVGDCPHTDICWKCVLRLNILCDENTCPICKKGSDIICLISVKDLLLVQENNAIETVGSSPPGLVSRRRDVDRTTKSEVAKTILNYPHEVVSSAIQSACRKNLQYPQFRFYDSAVEKKVLSLTGYSCNLCVNDLESIDDADNTVLPFKTLKDLQKHLRRAHRCSLCEICLISDPLFAAEQVYFPLKGESTACLDKLWEHALCDHSKKLNSNKKGLPRFASPFVPIPPQKGKLVLQHPRCDFCRTNPFPTIASLLEHMTKSHFQCPLCESISGRENEFYTNYVDLFAHFLEFHFPCMHDACITNRFSVFKDRSSLEFHDRCTHGSNRRDNRRGTISVPIAASEDLPSPGRSIRAPRFLRPAKKFTEQVPSIFLEEMCVLKNANKNVECEDPNSTAKMNVVLTKKFVPCVDGVHFSPSKHDVGNPTYWSPVDVRITGGLETVSIQSKLMFDLESFSKEFQILMTQCNYDSLELDGSKRAQTNSLSRMIDENETIICILAAIGPEIEDVPPKIADWNLRDPDTRNRLNEYIPLIDKALTHKRLKLLINSHMYIKLVLTLRALYTSIWYANVDDLIPLISELSPFMESIERSRSLRCDIVKGLRPILQHAWKPKMISEWSSSVQSPIIYEPADESEHEIIVQNTKGAVVAKRIEFPYKQAIDRLMVLLDTATPNRYSVIHAILKFCVDTEISTTNYDFSEDEREYLAALVRSFLSHTKAVFTERTLMETLVESLSLISQKSSLDIGNLEAFASTLSITSLHVVRLANQKSEVSVVNTMQKVVLEPIVTAIRQLKYTCIMLLGVYLELSDNHVIAEEPGRQKMAPTKSVMGNKDLISIEAYSTREPSGWGTKNKEHHDQHVTLTDLLPSNSLPGKNGQKCILPEKPFSSETVAKTRKKKEKKIRETAVTTEVQTKTPENKNSTNKTKQIVCARGLLSNNHK